MLINNTLVTAIITTHNRHDLLERAINSVAGQTYTPIEIIVVDDGSTDGTRERMELIVQRLPNVNYLRNEKPLGACNARNKGIREAKGEFVAGLDDDDEWMPDRIKIFIEQYESKYSMIGSNDLYISESRNFQIERKSEITLDDMLFGNAFGNQAFIKRQRLVDIGGFDEKLVAAQDYDMWVRLIAKYGCAKLVQEPLQKVYMDHDGSRLTITSSPKKFSGYFNFYKKHKTLMKANHRKMQLFKLYTDRGKRISFRSLTTLLVPGNKAEMIRYFIMTSKLKFVLKKHYLKFFSNRL